MRAKENPSQSSMMRGRRPNPGGGNGIHRISYGREGQIIRRSRVVCREDPPPDQHPPLLTKEHFYLSQVLSGKCANPNHAGNPPVLLKKCLINGKQVRNLAFWPLKFRGSRCLERGLRRSAFLAAPAMVLKNFYKNADIRHGQAVELKGNNLEKRVLLWQKCCS